MENREKEQWGTYIFAGLVFLQFMSAGPIKDPTMLGIASHGLLGFNLFIATIFTTLALQPKKGRPVRKPRIFTIPNLITLPLLGLETFTAWNIKYLAVGLTLTATLQLAATLWNYRTNWKHWKTYQENELRSQNQHTI